MSVLFRRISFYFALAGIALLIVLVRALSQKPPMPEPPVAPAKKPAAKAIAASGIVEAINENTSIGVPVPGLVTELRARVWAEVKKGDVLLQLDDRELKAQLLSQEAQVAVAHASLKRLEDQLRRLKSVTTPGAVTVDEISTRENDVSVAQAQLDAAKAQVAQTQALLARLTVTAPIDGTILKVNTRVGEYVSVTGKEPPLVMGQINNLQVRADIDEQLAPRVKRNQPARAFLKGSTLEPIELEFDRIEPFIVPKVSLTGSSSERVDTRVLQIIYRIKPGQGKTVYVGQQMDIFLSEE